MGWIGTRSSTSSDRRRALKTAVDAAELLRGEVPFIVDTSAWWRFPSLPSELVEEAIVDDRLWITPIVRMEILYSARNSTEYIAFETQLDGFRILRNGGVSHQPRT